MNSRLPGANENGGETLTATEIATARSHTYALFARLYQSGPTLELHPIVVGIPQLAEQMTDPFDADLEATHHQTLFGFNVFPHESVFLTGDGLLGGSITQQVVESYNQMGFDTAPDSIAPDHICQELGFLAYLCAAECDAHQYGHQKSVERLQQAQFDFLDRHLWRWLPPFADAVAEMGGPFYAALSDLTCRLAGDHLLTISLPSSHFDLPETDFTLDDSNTRLADIAELLIRPGRCGFLLSKADLIQLGRDFGLPTGFGERKQLLLNLMRSAVNFDRFPELVHMLQMLAARRHNAYGRQADQLPVTATYAHTWQERTAAIMELLAAAGRLAKDELAQLEASD